MPGEPGMTDLMEVLAARDPGLRRGDRRVAAISFSIDANGVTLAVRYREGELASMLKRLKEMRTQSVPVICD
jgi:hypothetical protein